MLLNGKNVNIGFLDSFVASYLKVGRYTQPIDLSTYLTAMRQMETCSRLFRDKD